MLSMNLAEGISSQADQTIVDYPASSGHFGSEIHLKISLDQAKPVMPCC
jgi:hypothetical protein